MFDALIWLALRLLALLDEFSCASESFNFSSLFSKFHSVVADPPIEAPLGRRSMSTKGGMQSMHSRGVS